MPQMHPYHDVTQYIENQAFAGRAVADILDELRLNGWSEVHITAAVRQLNEQHDVLQQIDMDPLHRKQKKRSRLGLILTSALIVLVVALGVFFVFTSRATSAVYTTFVDPNFTMQVPEDWMRDERYKPGASVIFFHARDIGVDTEATGAFMTLYLNLFEDQFGRQLLSGDTIATVLVDETESDNGVTRRYIEYERPSTIDAPESTRGAYILVTRGQLTVSATVASRTSQWGAYAAQAKTILTSITPNCSIKNLDALYDEDGAIILCQNEE